MTDETWSADVRDRLALFDRQAFQREMRANQQHLQQQIDELRETIVQLIDLVMTRK